MGSDLHLFKSVSHRLITIDFEVNKQSILFKNIDDLGEINIHYILITNTAVVSCGGHRGLRSSGI